MFYSDNHKHLHIHNPKTGGKSLMFTVMTNKGWLRDYPMHLTLPEIENRYSELNNKIKNYNKTIVIRNPWTHAVSYYYHALDNKRFYKENFFNAKNFLKSNDKQKEKIDLSFESFINNGYQKYVQERFYKETKNLKFDKVFKYENWEEIVDYFTNTYGINMVKTYNHHSRNNIQTVNNIKVFNDYRKLYNTNTIEKVADLSKDIIKKYNYTFE